MVGYLLLSFLLGISFTIASAFAVLQVLSRFKLLRNIQRDVDVDKRLLECEAAINHIALKVSEVSNTHLQSSPPGKDPELYDVAAESIGRDS
jgi:hypothetical protein